MRPLNTAPAEREPRHLSSASSLPPKARRFSFRYGIVIFMNLFSNDRHRSPVDGSGAWMLVQNVRRWHSQIHWCILESPLATGASSAYGFSMEQWYGVTTCCDEAERLWTTCLKAGIAYRD